MPIGATPASVISGDCFMTPPSGWDTNPEWSQRGELKFPNSGLCLTAMAGGSLSVGLCADSRFQLAKQSQVRSRIDDRFRHPAP